MPFQTPKSSIEKHFSSLSDFRVAGRSRYELLDVLTMAFCATICGADGWVAVEQFAKAKQSWFQTFLHLPHGVPSHDTFGRIFGSLKPEEFRECFVRWTSTLMTRNEDLIALDGKTLRASADPAQGQSPIHMVSAWASSNNLVLGQLRVDSKSNEITAIPQLLDLLDVQGALVTIDAMGCQRDIADQITRGHADYLLAVKANQPNLEKTVKAAIALQSSRHRESPESFFQHFEEAHGRSSYRGCTIIKWSEYKSLLSQKVSAGECSEERIAKALEIEHKWPDIQTLITIYSNQDLRAENLGKFKQRHYISSREQGDAEVFLSYTRRHWEVENQLHWVLDVQFDEDHSRIRKKNGAENMATLRHMALNLLKSETSLKVGIKNKRLRAGWDHAYLSKVIGLT